MRRILLITVAVLAAAVMFSGLALASPGFVSQLPADKASLSCSACHTSAIPALNDDGKAFKANGNKWPAAKPAPAAPKSSEPAKKAEPSAPKAAPSQTTKSVKLTVQNLSESKTVDGYQVGDKVLAPVRAVAEFLGGKVTGWDNAKKEAVIAYGGKAITVKAVKIVKGTGYADAAAYAASLGVSFDAAKATIKRGKSTVTTPQWEKTVHNYANITITDTSPSKRDNCIACHDGTAFALEKTKRAELPDPASVTSIGCSTCHSDRGKAIMNSGTTPVLANGYKITDAGAGALCMTCHNGRRLVPSSPKPDGDSAPHRSMQTDMLFGFGGYEFGLAFPTSPHAANPDTCVSCHMAEKDGVANHEFKVADAKASCGSCHAGLETVNRPALGDYDGDKVIEGIQDEVHGLITLLEHALEAAVPNGKLGESGGQVYFADKADATKRVSVAPEIYWAAWNLIAIENDGSHGIHNPAYTVKLLQESYKAVTGKPVPNATLR